MKDYFKELEKKVPIVSQEDVDIFRKELNKSFEAADASEEAIKVPDAAIRNAIRKGASSDDVVWAWIQ